MGEKNQETEIQEMDPKTGKRESPSRENPVPTHSQRETQRRRDGVRTTERQGHRENRIPSTETRKQEKSRPRRREKRRAVLS